MKFHKFTFPIRMIDAYCKREDVFVEVVTGWANEDYTIGFHKVRNGKAWAASDLVSGLRICTFETRKACAEWVEKNARFIEDKRCDPVYIKRVMEFKERLIAEKESM